MSDLRAQHDQLLELSALICDDQADEAAIARLDQILAADPEARQLYLRYVDLHMDLGRRMQPAEVVPSGEKGIRSWELGVWNWMALAALVALAVTAWLVPWSGSSTPQSELRNPQSHGIAVLTNSDHATWADNAEATLGTDLPAGLLKLESGTVQLMFKSGAVVDLAGPAELRLDGVNLAHLNYGSMKAYVPERARGFTVNTRQGVRVVDLGTEFVLWADQEGRCRMHVLSGQVIVTRDRGDEQTAEFVDLFTAGQGVEMMGEQIVRRPQTDAAFIDPWLSLGTPINLAEGAKALQSTTGAGRPAELAVDGDLSTSTHTSAADRTPNWRIDLGGHCAIDRMELYNRADCCGDRLRDLKVEVLAEDGKTVVFASEPMNARNALDSPPRIDWRPRESGERFVRGRYVRISRAVDTTTPGLRDDDRYILSLGEVRVFGWKLTQEQDPKSP